MSSPDDSEPTHGKNTRKLGRLLKEKVEKSGRSDLNVIFDHRKKGESHWIVPYFGEYGKATTLSHIDIAVTSENKIILLCEIEEGIARPKLVMGDLCAIFAADNIKIKKKDYDFTEAVIVYGGIVSEDGYTKQKAIALCERVPHILLNEAKKSIGVVPVLVNNQEDLVGALFNQIMIELDISI